MENFQDLPPLKFPADAYKFVLHSIDNMHTKVFYLLKKRGERENSGLLDSNAS